MEDIFQKYQQKNRHKFKKKEKNKMKTGKLAENIAKLKLEEIGFKYQQKMILNQLKQLTSLAKKLERRIAKLELKLDR